MDGWAMAEIMTRIACCGAASWLRFSATDVDRPSASSSGSGGGKNDRCYFGAEGNTDGSPHQEAIILQCHFTRVDKFLFDCHYI